MINHQQSSLLSYKPSLSESGEASNPVVPVSTLPHDLLNSGTVQNKYKAYFKEVPCGHTFSQSNVNKTIYKNNNMYLYNYI